MLVQRCSFQVQKVHQWLDGSGAFLKGKILSDARGTYGIGLVTLEMEGVPNGKGLQVPDEGSKLLLEGVRLDNVKSTDKDGKDWYNLTLSLLPDSKRKLLAGAFVALEGSSSEAFASDEDALPF